MKSSEIIDELLRLRGVTDREQFLHPSLAALAKPEELPGIDRAADVILAAVVAGREIVVFGDYDCDGVSATAILVRTLTVLGANVSPFLPERLGEGYGMSDAAVARCLAEHPQVGLIVTVDNGINSVGQVAALKEKGIPVVVTDHHLPGEELPAAEAIVNPKVAAPEHLSTLCGAGVAFFLANRLISEARARGLYSGPLVGGPLLVLAGLATVTDVMPLLGQNRIFVASALSHFHACAPQGLKELLLRAATRAVDRLTSRDFGFLLGPRINAAGRLKSGREALELVLSDDREKTRELARIIDGYNAERKAIEQEMTERAQAQLVAGAAAQVIDLPDGHPGVAGIVAARLLERMDRKVPVCVIAGDHGSARSPEGLNIRDAFLACAEYLTAFGGHAAAGGFSVKPGLTDAFRAALCEYCRKAAPSGAPSGVKVDLDVAPEDLTLELAEALVSLEPFGEGNREPVFGLKGVILSDIKTIGSDGKHLAFSIRGANLRGVAWSWGSRVEELRALGSVPHDLACTLAISEYGERHVELHVLSENPSSNGCLPADESGFEAARDILMKGGVAIIPTDTVYGLAAHPGFPEAVERLYSIKARDAKKPIALLASDADGAVRFIGEEAAAIGRRRWPCALTIVAQGEGVRVPDHDWTRRLIAACGGALRVTSANLSGQRAATDAEEALKDVGLSADLVIDDGVSPGGTASTVIKVEEGRISILREGPEKFLTLASGSPRRAKILKDLGVDFVIAKSDVAEVSYPHDPERTVRENALAKGGRGHVLSADTIVWFNGKIYGKPRDLDEAKTFLRELSGRTHTVFTGVAYDGEVKVVTSDVTFRALSDEMIDEYVARVKPTDRAGAYDIDESGDLIVASYTGSYENIMGLPVEPLAEWGLCQREAVPTDGSQWENATDFNGECS